MRDFWTKSMFSPSEMVVLDWAAKKQATEIKTNQAIKKQQKFNEPWISLKRAVEKNCTLEVPLNTCEIRQIEQCETFIPKRATRAGEIWGSKS